MLHEKTIELVKEETERRKAVCPCFFPPLFFFLHHSSFRRRSLLLSEVRERMKNFLNSQPSSINFKSSFLVRLFPFGSIRPLLPPIFTFKEQRQRLLDLGEDEDDLPFSSLADGASGSDGSRTSLDAAIDSVIGIFSFVFGNSFLLAFFHSLKPSSSFHFLVVSEHGFRVTLSQDRFPTNRKPKKRNGSETKANL